MKKLAKQHYQLGDVFEYCFWPGDCKAPVNHLGEVFRNYRSDKVSALGEINSNNRGVFEQENRR